MRDATGLALCYVFVNKNITISPSVLYLIQILYDQFTIDVTLHLKYIAMYKNISNEDGKILSTSTYYRQFKCIDKQTVEKYIKQSDIITHFYIDINRDYRYFVNGVCRCR